MRVPYTFSVPFAAAVLAVACSNPGARESTLRGTAALGSFASAPSTVVARNETGGVLRAAVDGQGNFVLPLAKGHRYRLSLEGTGGGVPFVFPRTSGRLDASFVLNTNGAALNVGIVRDYPGVPAGGFHVLAAKLPGSSPGADCVDCVNDDPQVTCDGNDPESTAGEATAQSDTAEQADATREMAIADQNVPEQVDGCENDDGDQVDQQQEGEH
jgi:hypothetical protein